MAIMKDKLLELLEDGPLTVDEITGKLNLDDTFMVVSMITELEHIDKKIQLVNFKTCYESDGSPFYIAKYGLIPT